MSQKQKPARMSFWQIWNMSFGFLGIQYAFGLQQANMSPIYRYLGADEAEIPWLWLAGPVTGLIIQPIVGAMSDATWHKRWGRRRPYFMVGAVLTSIALVLMPYSSSLWMAAGLLWLLDGAANITMEPFRALIADNLPEEQRITGFSLQSFFVGIGQTLANLMPIIMVGLGVSVTMGTGSDQVPDFVKWSFMVGAAAILISVGITVFTTDEYPTSEPQPQTKHNVFAEVVEAFKDMPAVMRQLWWVKFFTWFALPLMWQYLAIAIANRCFNASGPNDPGFADGVKWGNLGLAVFNVACFLFSMLLQPISRYLQAKQIHALALALGAIGFISMEFMNHHYGFMVSMTLVGIAWASIMSTPYVILSTGVPQQRMGVYMGVFNMFIVVPQICNMVITPLIYNNLLGGQAIHAMALAGGSLVLAAIMSLRLKDARGQELG